MVSECVWSSFIMLYCSHLFWFTDRKSKHNSDHGHHSLGLRAFPADHPGSSHSSKTDFCRFVLNELETTVAVNVIIYQETFHFRAKWQITILSLREKPLSVHLLEWGQYSQQDTAAANQIHASLLNYFVTWTLWKATLQLVQQNKKNNSHWKYNWDCVSLSFPAEKRKKDRKKGH